MNTSNKAHKGILGKAILMLGIIVLVILIVFVVIIKTQKPNDLHIGNVDISAIKDGVYIGSADNGLINATVSVEVINGTILNIKILEHEQLLGKKAEKITESIIEQQSLEVDAITSATYSSDTLRKAIENALRQGE